MLDIVLLVDIKINTHIVGYDRLLLGWCALRALSSLFANSWSVGVAATVSVSVR